MIAAFLSVADYARKETVTGYLAPTAGVVKIVAPRPGIIRAIHVKEGQRIEAGQPLVTVAIEQTTAEGENVDATMLRILEGQKARIDEQLTLQERHFQSEGQRLRAQIAGIDAEIAQIGSQIVIQRERIANLTELIAAGQGLRAKGYLSDVEYKRRYDQMLEQKQGLGTLQQRTTTLQADRTSAGFNLDQLPTTRAEKIEALRAQLSEVEQRITEINGRRAYVVHAPVGGRVATLQALVGRTADSQRMLMSILPVDSVFQAELFVPTKAVGFVRLGQEVRILYDAYPFQRFGTHRGRIIQVAHTILTSADLSAPVALGDPAYKVTVALEQQEIAAFGQRLPLQADMLLHADILLDRRPLLVWLLNPLLGMRL
ncbi:HlyD family efflux transporter periplasmic adaptor subunit [Azospirillum rugosum]|uniref:Membrane fusion protein n=1 Tax=Azospirillum rugosum TaxID=416170 RepID=A0ABS4SUC4_9PROT|nr:HlyD family efflux transporter periplasmic adaptor subunit [Azospirillum rugosum]MBP2294985.1 membrane fusion protein [Azospirillum rugosum]MDQ0528808.1 membrane fusion protein [Azospirillum rugosum]